MKTWPGVLGVAPLNPEKVTYTVLPVASLALGRICVTARLGSGALSIAVQAATLDPSTVRDTDPSVGRAGVGISLPLMSAGNTPIQLT